MNCECITDLTHSGAWHCRLWHVTYQVTAAVHGVKQVQLSQSLPLTHPIPCVQLLLGSEMTQMSGLVTIPRCSFLRRTFQRRRTRRRRWNVRRRTEQCRNVQRGIVNSPDERPVWWVLSQSCHIRGWTDCINGGISRMERPNFDTTKVKPRNGWK